MPSKKPQILIRPTEEQLEAIRAASLREPIPQSLSNFVLSTVMTAVQSPAKLPTKTAATFFRQSQELATRLDQGELLPSTFGVFQEAGEDSTEPDPMVEREFRLNVNQEFYRQHEFCMANKRFKEYKSWTWQERYEYFVKQKQEAGDPE